MKNILLVLCLLIGTTTTQSQEQPSASIGPENGSLLVVGGGRLGDDIVNKFIELAGGIASEFVVIPTASGNDEYNTDPWLARVLKERGASKVTVLHTKDRNVADSKKFTQPLTTANAVWFGGGRQWRLVDSYKNTLTEVLIKEVLERGGVVGGSSAGATIQGSFLARGDTKNNQIMSGDHQEGFSLIKNVAIDQHVLARNRQFDMFTILKEHPHLLGLSIDENTSIVVQKNEFEVLGSSYVLVYDGTFWSKEGSGLKQLPSQENLFYFLKNGDRYDLLNRKVIND